MRDPVAVAEAIALLRASLREAVAAHPHLRGSLTPEQAESLVADAVRVHCTHCGHCNNYVNDEQWRETEP